MNDIYQFRKHQDALFPLGEDAAEWYASIDNGDTVELKVVRKSRTGQQNNAMHKYFSMVSGALNDAGYDLLNFPWKEMMQLPWSGYLFKQFIWHPVMKAVTGKDSTADLERGEVDQVYQVVSRKLAETTGVTTPFPSREAG